LAVVALAAGLAIGGWIGTGVPRATSVVTTTTIPLPPLPAVPPARGALLPACQAAVQSADEVISYLIGGIRDRRLETALQRYVAVAYSCRKETS
jgi:hypothetical protein